MNIWEIDERIREIVELEEDEELVDLDTGEVITVAQALEQLNMAREAKIEGAALAYKNMDAEARALREEERKLADRRRALENRAEQCKAYLLGVLYPEGGEPERFATARVAISPRLNNPSAVIDDEAKIPREYLRVKTEVARAEILNAIKSGIEVPGAHIERSRRVDIR